MAFKCISGTCSTYVHGTSPTTACQSPKFLVASICDLPDIINCQFRAFEIRAFFVAGPTVWNSLHDHLRDPDVDFEKFRWELKTYLLPDIRNVSALEVLRNRSTLALYKSTLTLLTYFTCLPACLSCDRQFRRQLKTFLFGISWPRRIMTVHLRLINTFTNLLTYYFRDVCRPVVSVDAGLRSVNLMSLLQSARDGQPSSSIVPDTLNIHIIIADCPGIHQNISPSCL